MESTRTPPRLPAAPTQCGSYVIMLDAEGRPRQLGTGTFGRTYLAQHHYLETLAALKILNERFAVEPAARERFLREGRALVRLDHRHIARLLDFGEADGALFYAMEYCAGGDLARRVQQGGPLTLETWLRVARQLASALECCHQMDFIHRDLKPSNVMLAHEHEPLVVKLIDFGMVHTKHKEHDADPAVIGTPLYASPEQLREEKVDARSDLFSLGMTLWHLAIGAPPETGSSAQIIASRLSAESYAPRTPPHLPPPLRSLLARLLEKDAAGRPQSAAEVLALLQDAGREAGLAHLVSVEELEKNESVESEGATTFGPEPEPMPMEEKDALLESDYQVLSSAAEQHTGLNYLATPPAPGRGTWWLHSLHPQLVSDGVLLRKLRIAAARLRAQPTPDCLVPELLRSYRDFVVLVSPGPAGALLSTQLKEHGKCELPAVLPLLTRIAQTADRLLLSGLPGVELRPNAIYVSGGALAGGEEFSLALVPRWLRVEETLDLTAAVALRDGVSGTLTTELLDEQIGSDRPAVQLARLIFRFVAGRDCPAAASASTRGYVPVAELSEANNRLLSQVIAGQTPHATCGALLADLQGLGGGGASLSRTAQGQRSATRSATRSAGQAAAPLPATASQVLQSPVPPQAPAARVGLAQPPLVPRSSPRPRWLAGAAVAAALLVGFFVLRQKSGTASPSGSPGPAGAEKLPAYAVLQLVGEPPASSVYSVGGQRVEPHLLPGKIELPLPASAPLPVTATVQAIGFQPYKVTITRLAELQEARPIVLERSKGTLVISRQGPCDYDAIGVKMLQLLEKEQGSIPLDHSTFSKTLSTGEQEVIRWDLPTGIYDLRFLGSSRQVNSRSFQRVTIEPGGEQSCALPPSYLGDFAGELTTSGSAASPATGAVRLRLLQKLTEGELVEGRRLPLEGLRVNSEWVLNGTVGCAHGAATPVYDQILTGQLSPDGNELEVKLVELFTDDAGAQASVKRPPYSEAEWQRSGKLHRQTTRAR